MQIVKHCYSASVTIRIGVTDACLDEGADNQALVCSQVLIHLDTQLISNIMYNTVMFHPPLGGENNMTLSVLCRLSFKTLVHKMTKSSSDVLAFLRVVPLRLYCNLLQQFLGKVSGWYEACKD